MVAVSADDREGAQKMVDRKRLTFPVLSDPDGVMLRAYRHWNEDDDLGLAGTFVIRRDRNIVFYEDDGERFYRRPSAARLLEALELL